MKCKIDENIGGFWIEFESETLEEAVTVARFGINRVKRLEYADVFASKDGCMKAQMSIRSRKETRSPKE